MKRTITLLAPPFVLAIAFYLLVPSGIAAEFVARHLSASWRLAVAKATSHLPFSLVEVLAFLGIAWLIYAIVRLILPHKRGHGLRSLLALVVVVINCGALFLWVGCPRYFASQHYEDALTRRDISVAELLAAAEYFRDGANRTANSVARDGDGVYNEPIDVIFLLSEDVFDGLAAQFPALEPTNAVPKSLLTSGFMSRTGYTGIYFALTGEANVNTKMPRALLPVTVAHELAHSRGVAREDAANFFGIAACVTSGMPRFEYSGYLDALLYLGNELYRVDPQAYYDLSATYSDAVRRDLKDNSDYWAAIVAKNADNAAMSAVSAAVNTAYDGFMRANAQENGMATYGECVDLLVIWALESGA